MGKTILFQNRACFSERRKNLRNNATTAERMLWKQIRNEQLGVKFRRQYNIGNFIVDFFCHEFRLIIEVDGWIHGEEGYEQRDKKRQMYLEGMGNIVLRYRNEQIKFEIDAVIQDIVNQLTKLQLSKTPPNLPS